MIKLSSLSVVEKNTARVDTPQRKIRERDLKKACADFESIFIYYMLQTLRKTVPKSNLFSMGSSCKDTYTMMFDQKMAEDLATRGEGMGLQKMLLDQFKT